MDRWNSESKGDRRGRKDEDRVDRVVERRGWIRAETYQERSKRTISPAAGN